MIIILYIYIYVLESLVPEREMEKNNTRRFSRPAWAVPARDTSRTRRDRRARARVSSAPPTPPAPRIFYHLVKPQIPKTLKP